MATAHRSGVGAELSIPGSYNFFSAATAVTVANYVQIWLFGFSGAALQANEQTHVAQFMQSGGGTSATGDHGSLGAGMGANVPRVRTMRNWSSVPMSNPQRLDTVVDHGSDGVKQFDDQADAIAQRMFPVFFPMAATISSYPHHPCIRCLPILLVRSTNFQIIRTRANDWNLLQSREISPEMKSGRHRLRVGRVYLHRWLLFRCRQGATLSAARRRPRAPNRR